MPPEQGAALILEAPPPGQGAGTVLTGPALLRDARISIPPLLLPIVPADLLDDTAHDGRSALHMA